MHPRGVFIKSIIIEHSSTHLCSQATINIGTIGHVAHGKSTVVKAISGVNTVRTKPELERNITIKLGYANAKIYKAEPAEEGPGNYRWVMQFNAGCLG